MTPDAPRRSIEELHPRIRARFPMIDRDATGRPRLYLNTGAGSLTVDAAAVDRFLAALAELGS